MSSFTAEPGGCPVFLLRSRERSAALPRGARRGGVWGPFEGPHFDRLAARDHLAARAAKSTSVLPPAGTVTTRAASATPGASGFAASAAVSARTRTAASLRV